MAMKDSFQELLVSSIADLDTTAQAPSSQQDDRRSKLLEGLVFSRKFIISYNVVLVVILMLFTVQHWSSIYLRERRHRNARAKISHGGKSGPDAQAQETSLSEAMGSGSSSRSSSTLGPEREDRPDETTSLIRPTASRLYSAPSHIVRSWLMYQPSNIPIINKTLPSNATSLVVALFLALNMFYLLYRVPIAIAYAFVLGDRAGLVFVANLPLLYLFAAKNQPLKAMTGQSYENLNIVHRRLGEWMCLLALLHFAEMMVTYFTLFAASASFGHFLSIPIIWLGLITFVSYELLYLTSLGSFRQRFYELFLVSHVVLQVVALTFLFLHHSTSRPYVGIALAIFLIDRLVFRLWLKSQTLTANLSIMDDGETILISTDWALPPPQQQRRWWQQIPTMKHGWIPTDHIFLTVPALSKTHILQAHPFTIASSAPHHTASHANLNLIIRARTGFSRALLTYTQSHPSARVRLDGPYGSSHALDLLRTSDHAVIVAGGSGIAVAYPLVCSLLSSYDNDTAKTKKVTLIWVLHDEDHIEWIGNDRLSELREKGLHVIVPAPTRKAGRPDIEGLLEMVLADDHGAASSVGVVVSGPDGMNRGVRNACAGMVRGGRRVGVAVEKFGW